MIARQSVPVLGFFALRVPIGESACADDPVLPLFDQTPSGHIPQLVPKHSVGKK